VSDPADLFRGLVPDNVEGLSPYEPGKPIEELERELGVTGAIKLASNENPLGPSPKGQRAAETALRHGSRYPDGGGHALRQALAARLKVSVDEIVLGSGSNDLIDLLVRTFCVPGRDEVVTHRYAFLMYKVACGAHGVKLVEAPVSDELGCDVDALAAAVTPRTKLVFLPNPNNPTGGYVARAGLERLFEKLPRGVVLVVDEAYHEYAARLRPDYPDAESYRSPERPLLVTLRTFSKIYGLAGLRIGYAVTDRRIASYLNRVRLPFNTSSPAQEAALAALDDGEHVERSWRANEAGLKALSAGFQALGLRVHPSVANFVLVDVGREAAPVYEALLRKGVIVRALRPAGLPNHLRVSVGTGEEIVRALAAFAEVLGR
jgi:histidinol-phosphate aminotransferase